MTITAKIIKHSINEYGNELLTVECRYNRCIHSELMTHRLFSRNAASSRAIPIKKMLKDIKADMAMPVFWGKNKPGMQAREELTGWKLKLAKFIWIVSGHIACWFAWLFSLIGLHKQLSNRIIEPWSHITVLISSTEWDNFFSLRIHPDAMPEIKALATAIYEAKAKSIPTLLKSGEWHTPYDDDIKDMELKDRQAISSARCASTSYKTVDGKMMTLDKAKDLGHKLFSSEPLHASPAEHLATPDTMVDEYIYDMNTKRVTKRQVWSHPELHGNFQGFIQYRKTFPNEVIKSFVLNS